MSFATSLPIDVGCPFTTATSATSPAIGARMSMFFTGSSCFTVNSGWPAVTREPTPTCTAMTVPLISDLTTTCSSRAIVAATSS